MEDDKLSNDGWTDTVRRQATVYSTLKTGTMIKSKFGQRLRSKTLSDICVIIQSMYELDITPEFMGEVAW